MAAIAHKTTIVTFTPSDPPTALPQYYWLCACGRRGASTANTRRARNGGAKHVASMERGK
jgi:hypothetical protein